MSPATMSRALPVPGRPRQIYAAPKRRSHWPTRPTPTPDTHLNTPPTIPWTPLLTGLLPDLTQDDFTQLTTDIRGFLHALRIATLNINGGLLELPVPGAPTKLHRLVWLFHYLRLDFLLIQEHRIPAAREAAFREALAYSGTLLNSKGHAVTKTLDAYFAPATKEGVGGCLILCAQGWSARHPWHQPLPNGRGQLLELSGEQKQRLLLLNIYNKSGGASSDAAYDEAKAILTHAQETLNSHYKNAARAR